MRNKHYKKHKNLLKDSITNSFKRNAIRIAKEQKYWEEKTKETKK